MLMLAKTILEQDTARQLGFWQIQLDTYASNI